MVVFPGGDYDAYRPTLSENVIDFNGRKGYVSTAIEAGVPIVPAVSIGGQETQLYLSRGTWLAERLGLKRLLRSDDSAALVRLPVRVQRRDPAEFAAADQDRHAGAGTDRRRRASSATTRTSTRSTSTCGR